VGVEVEEGLEGKEEEEEGKKKRLCLEAA